MNESIFHRKDCIDDLLAKQMLLRDWESSNESAEVFAKSRGVNRSTLYRLQERRNTGLSDLLDGRKTAVRTRTAVTPNHLKWLKGYLANFPKAPLTVVCEELNKIAAREGWPTVKYTSLRAAYLAIPSDERSILRDDEEEFFEQHFPIGKRITTGPLDMVQIDATELDVWVVDMQTGAYFKPWLTAVIDCCTRVVLEATVHTKAPSGKDTLGVLKRAIMPKKNPQRPWFGIWKVAQTDNGRANIDSLVAGAMLRIGVDYQQTPVECSSANGKVERWFSTCKTRLLKKLKGFAETDEALKKAKHTGAIPYPLMQRIVDRFLDSDYHLRVHSELGMSPWEAWHERLDCISGLIFDVKSVSDALRYPEEVTVDRGAIRVDRTTYKAAELGALNDKSVIVLTDPETPRKKVDVFYKNKFLCQAIREDGDLADDLNVERTDRIIRLKKVKRDAKKAFEDTPPLETWPVKKPRSTTKPKPARPKPLKLTPTLETEE